MSVSSQQFVVATPRIQVAWCADGNDFAFRFVFLPVSPMEFHSHMFPVLGSPARQLCG